MVTSIKVGTMNKPHFSQAADNNKGVILEQLRKVLQPGNQVLEIASGTGQHAAHFSAQMPEIIWQPSDRDLQEYDLVECLAGSPQSNLLAPIELDINHWPELPHQFDTVYSANCVHIIDWPSVENYVRGAASCLKSDGAFILYGPFKYGGDFTSESNRQFDGFLRETYPGGGIRDFEAIDELARKQGLSVESDTPMPANNQMLVWR